MLIVLLILSPSGCRYVLEKRFYLMIRELCALMHDDEPGSRILSQFQERSPFDLRQPAFKYRSWVDHHASHRLQHLAVIQAPQEVLKHLLGDGEIADWHARMLERVDQRQRGIASGGFDGLSADRRDLARPLLLADDEGGDIFNDFASIDLFGADPIGRNLHVDRGYQ
jgi:hypothetical protein